MFGVGRGMVLVKWMGRDEDGWIVEVLGGGKVG